MSSKDNSFTEFLADYFVESEEHLGSIRHHLLEMENLVHRSPTDPDVSNLADKLLRALHSLKGLSAMAGVHEAEKVAHAMEDSLRNLKQAGTGSTEDAMEALANGASIIEQVVVARRDQKPGPDIHAVLLSLVAVAPRPGRIWRFEFNPSAELQARGVNVNSIRTRLEEIGQLRSATPRIVEGGRITFEFIVESDADERRFSDWQSDGLAVSRYNSSITEAEELADTREVAPPVTAASVVRVDMKRLDDLMTMVGGLVITRGRVEESLRRLETILPASAWRELQESNLLLQRQLRDLREGFMHVRMVPIGQIFDRMRFAIRDFERENHKSVRLEWTGQATAVDKLVVERMMDPLLHMVRNAVNHGLEPSEERIRSGKPREGHLWLRASAEAETVVIEVEDDGRGVDIERVGNRARSLGLIDSVETFGKTMDNALMLHMMCIPGFSTRDEADLDAGRGVGMAVVKTTVSSLGGSLVMDTRPGEGTRFTIRLPLTLAIMQALIVYIDDQPFAAPRSAIHEVLRVESRTMAMQGTSEVIPYHAGVLPIVYLNRIFRMNEKREDSFHVLVAGSGAAAMGIAVDRIAGQKEIVVRPVDDSLVRVRGIAGVTELGDGRPVLILDVAAIADAVHEKPMKLVKEEKRDHRLHPRPRPVLAEKGSFVESFVLFELAGNTCGVRSQAVQAVAMVEHVAAVPNAAPFVDGVALMRGQVIPSINLRSRLGFPRIPADLRARMLIVRSRDRTIGLLVDGAREFISIPADAIRAPSETDKAMDGGFSVRYVEGIAALGNRIVSILNLDEVIEGV